MILVAVGLFLATTCADVVVGVVGGGARSALVL